jgi:hypothetical protein
MVVGESASQKRLVTLMVADADLPGKATLVAVIVTEVGAPSTAGAAYKPVGEIVPKAGDRDQVTAWFEDPVTVAANCNVRPAVTRPVGGVTDTEAPPNEKSAIAVPPFATVMPDTVCAGWLVDRAVT